MSSNDEFQPICLAGPKKPRLESLAVNQWSLANIAIMHKLVQDGTLPLSQVFDYLSYSTYMHRLMSACELVSVYLFDREYRKLQHIHNFRWGTVVGHLSTQQLRLRPPTPMSAMLISADAMTKMTMYHILSSSDLQEIQR